jgi:hypothetical protein
MENDPGGLSGASSNAAVPLISYSSPLTQEVRCQVCGSSVSGLPDDAACPDCGAPVAISSRELLCNAPGPWVGTLARGAWITLVGAAIYILAVGATSNLIFMQVFGPRAFIFMDKAGVFARLIMIVGSWILTEPNPSGVGEERDGRAREFVRIALVFALLDLFLGYIATPRRMLTSLPWVRFGMLTTIGLVAVSGQVVLLRYLGRLALRIPKPLLAAIASCLGPAFGVALGAQVLLYHGEILIIQIFPPHSGAHFFVDSFDLYRGQLLAEKCLVSITIVFALLLVSLARAFRREATADKRSTASTAASVAADGGA